MTVYNRYENRETGRVEWRRTVLGGTRVTGGSAVHWEDNRTAKSLTNGLRTVDIMIWYEAVADGGRTYLPPKAYAAVEPEHIDRYWTLTPGADRVAKGRAPEPAGPDALNDILLAEDDCATVTGVDTLDFGSPEMWHFEVSAK